MSQSIEEQGPSARDIHINSIIPNISLAFFCCFLEGGAPGAFQVTPYPVKPCSSSGYRQLSLDRIDMEGD